MLSSLLLATAFQIGPFYQQKPADDYFALRPFVAREGEVMDVCWPLFTRHRDWWSFCLLMNWQDHADSVGYQFSLAPIWFSGRDGEKGRYGGLFPLGGYHPHIGMMYDLKFALWPLWHQYRMPRIAARDGQRCEEWLETNSVLFPFFSWRSDGSWSFWPVYGVNRQRESVHRYVFWPLVSWAGYESDRDTAGAGYSWMCWPLCGRVRRERESRDLLLPPFFDFARVWSPASARRGNSGPNLRIRCPWPFFEYESTAARTRLSLWPVYERTVERRYGDGGGLSSVTRFGRKLVELYDDETRVFPFWASGRDHFRLWPLWESEMKDGVTYSRTLALMPIRWVPQIDRNWAKFWTLYENASTPDHTDHSLFWGLIRWRTLKK
ncbi:MAG: hypothetical protein ACI4R9_02535 [Kiritimatiellia bacterium]